MITIDCAIVGITPMLQHRFEEGSEVDTTTRTIIQNRGTPREQAEKVVYRNGNGFYFPGTWIASSITEAGGAHKLRGSRKSAKYVVPAAVRVKEIDIPVRNGDGKTLAADFEVDSRPVSIPATKGRIMRHRPRFDVWSAQFTLTINDKLLPEEFVHQLLTEAGEQQGIGDFRPQRRGPFGTFRVVRWDRMRD
jgi:hypothetical protein